MNTIKRLVAVILIVSSAGSGAAWSQDYGRGGRDDSGGRGGERNGRGDHRDDGGPGGPDGRRNDRQDYGSHGRGHERGAGPRHDLYRGQRLSYEYRSRQYVINDWRGHRLSPPPRGYHWVQVGGDYVMVAIATGIIASILFNN